MTNIDLDLEEDHGNSKKHSHTRHPSSELFLKQNANNTKSYHNSPAPLPSSSTLSASAAGGSRVTGTGVRRILIAWFRDPPSMEARVRGAS